VEEYDPEVSVAKWEQEDVNFEDEYILDRPPGKGRSNPRI
jgi:hypothetical protein